MSREWAMPDSSTFEIRPIRKLLHRVIGNSDGLWIDPFSGGSDVADITNDLNPKIQSDYTLHAADFLARFDEGEIGGGVIYDPPYSPRQVRECYDNIGIKTTQEDTQMAVRTKSKQEIETITAQGATVVSFGWNSNGMGKARGFEKDEILLVAHGGGHNDTIVTVEQRVRSRLTDFEQ